MRVTAIAAPLADTLDEVVADGVGAALGVRPVEDLQAGIEAEDTEALMSCVSG